MKVLHEGPRRKEPNMIDTAVKKARSSNLRDREEAYQHLMCAFNEMHRDWPRNRISEGPSVCHVCVLKTVYVNSVGSE